MRNRCRSRFRRLRPALLMVASIFLPGCTTDGTPDDAADVAADAAPEVDDASPEVPDAAEEVGDVAEDAADAPEEGAEAGPEDGDDTAVDGGDDGPFPVGVWDGTITDPERAREIAYRVYYPEGLASRAPVVLVSHGGDGSTNGHLQLAHLGNEFARSGYLSIHLNHLPSTTLMQHRLDRPADVSFVLDRLEDGSLPMPPAFAGEADLDRVGHTGHSWGAYTSHAVGGALFDQGSFRDERIRAICPLSPQGPGQFGSFDRGPDDNSWREVAVPAYNFVGGDERDGSAGGGIEMPDWRL
ncbi:MAG: hypothetical protein JXB32_24410, partial [Deltaproteobacteria bacterium]|nr:hypothetical protein [Deltaproteobacteria bacterium]